MSRYWWVYIFVVCVFGHAMADPTHNINQIVGDRALGLAGAYAGISDDPAGMFYNPSGIAYTSSANVSANVNTGQMYSITYQDALAGEFDFVRESFQVLPNFFGVIQPMGPYVVGFSSSIVDSVHEKQSQVFDDLANVSVESFVFNSNYLDTTYNVGPSIARRFDNNISLGMSLHMHYRSAELITNQHVKFLESDPSDRNISWQSSIEKTQEIGIKPKLGVMWSPLESLSLGLSVDKAVVLTGTRTSQSTSCKTNSVDIGCLTQEDPVINEFDIDRQYPWQVRIGGAWFPNNALLLSADAIYHSPTDATLGFAAHEFTLDGALGVEWYWSPKWALRSGMYTSFANTPNLVIGQTNQEQHVNLYGATFSVTRFNQGSSISLGILANYGVGESQLFSNLESVLQDTTLAGATAYFTTSYRY